jgi:iron complex outermembrane recepter protein
MKKAGLRRCRLWLASVLAFILWTVGTAGAQPSAHLSGTVKDATNTPLADVTITIRGLATLRAQTDSDGHFDFRDLPDGEYALSATMPGFAPARRTFRLTAGKPATVSLTLYILVQEQTVVTAAKTGEGNLQATPMAVSLLSGTELQRAEAHTVAQIAGLAPTVTFSQNSDYAQLFIRGIGSNVVFAGSDPSSAVYIDGVYIARPVMVLADFLDLERVEVLRGPQGTLYGRNAVGGALSLITKSPTNDVEASARVTAGNLRTLRTEARLSGPIVRDRVLGSAAIFRGVRQGFVRDLDHPDHPLGGEDVTALMTKLHVVFDRRSSVLISGDLAHKDPIPLTYAKVIAVKPGFRVDNPADLHEVRASTLARNRTLQGGAAARLTTQLPGATTLTSLTAFRKLDFDNLNDADITELNLTEGHVREVQHQWSEEVTVSRTQPRLTWIAGLFLFDEVDRQPISIRFGETRVESILDPRVAANGAAVFGQVTAGVSERVSATAGLRYARERKTMDNAGELHTLDSPMTPLPGSAYAYTDSISHTAWTPKFGLEVRTHENALAFLSAARGFKSGGFNFTSPEAGRGFAPEWAWSYEGGLKTVVAGGRAMLNVAVFQTDYSDLQVQTAIRPGVIDISNAAEATIRGVELEGRIPLTRALHAGGHLAWMDAEYDSYIAVGVGGVTSDVAGHRLSNAPGWSGRLWLEWNAGMGRGGLASLRADSRWQSTVFFTPFNDDIQRQSPYGLLDVSAEFGPADRRWSIAAFARNLMNVNYITGTFSSPPPAIGGRPGESRQVGLQLTIRSNAR